MGGPDQNIACIHKILNIQHLKIQRLKNQEMF